MSEECTFDMTELVKQLKNNVAIQLIGAMCPDEKSRAVLEKSMQIFLSHNVEIETAMKIMSELGHMFSEEGAPE